jgi:hypothetical protein
VPQYTDSTMELANLDVILLDVLARVLHRRGVIRTRKIITSDNLTCRSQDECAIAEHEPTPMLYLKSRLTASMHQFDNRRRNLNGSEPLELQLNIDLRGPLPRGRDSV